MTTLLIVAHAPLASALKALVAHVDAELESQVEALDVGPGSSPEQVAAQALALLDRLGRPETLVLADVAYATPCNGVVRLLDDPSLRLRVLAGVNVPMLWRALCYRARPLDELLRLASDGATSGVLPVTAPPPPPLTPCSPADAQVHDHDQQ